MTVREGSSWAGHALGYLALPHPLAIFLVETATLGFALIAWGGMPPTGLLLRLLVAMLGGQLAIGAVNDVVDLADDAIGKPHKPLPSGAVSRGGARAMIAAGVLVMFVAGATLGRVSLVLLLIGTGLGLAYDLWLKRTAWSWLPYLLALPLLPIWVFASLDRFEQHLLLLFPLGALASIGVHFAQSLPDISADRDAGISNPTSRLGARPTFVLAWLAALSAPLLAWFFAGRLAGSGAGATLMGIVVLSVLSMATNVVMLAANDRLGSRACFPLIGLVVLASGLAWTVEVAR